MYRQVGKPALRELSAECSLETEACLMEFSFTPEQERLRKEVRALLQKEVTDESRLDFRFDRPYSQDTWNLLRKLGERGWLCPLYPKEWGGVGASPPDNPVIQDELSYAFAPAPFPVIAP